VNKRKLLKDFKESFLSIVVFSGCLNRTLFVSDVIKLLLIKHPKHVTKTMEKYADLKPGFCVQISEPRLPLRHSFLTACIWGGKLADRKD